ncbi:hypothetical protein FIV42_03160 [Persicimonas caeni]|uniref:Uncharacterized protein n=1 Tax=Persicimonas caeni TaxID=2292766 RepID=A0A4Y6PNE2_PERCE|nr:hypothetical protein [Persicimonas caeni]QDG49770.1 hypothetical protein FIV42_03160 [Persicimonas caeni]QED30991.1 hypothetical protein FRD00_03155 [Persicimonas caeni]
MQPTHIQPIRALFAGALLCLAPVAATALDDPCERRDERANSAEDASLRTKASRFAPRVAVRIWFQTQDDRRDAARAWPNAVTAAPVPAPAPAPDPAPLYRDADRVQPFGWQVGVRWNLVEMAEATDLLEPNIPELTPTECLRRIEIDDFAGEEE